jgi:hypothetical protein
MQTFFRESSGAEFHPVKITSRYSDSLAASAIIWRDTDNSLLRVKVRPTDPSPCSLCVIASTHFRTAVTVISELWNDQIQMSVDNVFPIGYYMCFATVILTSKPFADRKLWTSCCEPDNTCTSTSSYCRCKGIKSHCSDVQRCEGWKLVQKPT